MTCPPCAVMRIVSGRFGTAAQTGLTRDAVLIARNLGPAELLEYDKRRLKGVVLEEGSLTSHMTIVARAIGVPVIGRLHDIRLAVHAGEIVGLAGLMGVVADLDDREALLQGDPDVYFTTPHYEGSPHVLVRLEAVDREELAGLVEDAWRLTAPASLVAGRRYCQ